jgi:hypothetical protein
MLGSRGTKKCAIDVGGKEKEGMGLLLGVFFDSLSIRYDDKFSN